jgi:hypothetical protein
MTKQSVKYGKNTAVYTEIMQAGQVHYRLSQTQILSKYIYY